MSLEDDDLPAQPQPVPAEMRAHLLLLRAHAEGAAEVFADAGVLADDKAGADLLVKARLAAFADEGRTQIALTNAGRYWALHGGYLAFLKEPPADRGGGGGRERNPELEEVRLVLMKRRLNTFWWSFGLSVASFLFSITSLIVAMTLGERMFPR